LSLIGKSMLKALNCNYCEIMTRDYELGQLVTRSLQRSTTWESGQVFAAPRLLSKLDKTTYLWVNKHDMLPEEQLLLDSEVDHALFILIDGTGLLCLSYVGDKPVDSSAPTFISNLELKGRELQSRWQAHEHSRALHTARQILRSTEASGCSWWLRTPDGLQLALDESNFVWGNATPTRYLDNYPALDQSLKHLAGHSYCVDSSTLPPDMYQLFDELNVSVLMVVPFVIQEGNTGLMLIADTNRHYDFDSREINLAHAMVLQAANAIKNAQLFEDLQNSLEVLRRTQAKLVQTARLSAIGELAAAVAHQINNPLTTILGDTELLLGDMTATDPKLESLQAVHRAGQRAHEVVRRLLSMSRQKSSVEVPQLMNINASIHNTLALVEGTLYRGRIQVKVNLADQLPDAYGLSGQLEDVWLNLLLNARDALREVKKPIIEITSRYDIDSNMVEVAVADNGIGLAGVDLESLFDAFYTTKPAGEGTGLGLYICANVVERCGGKIITGASQYNGALFTVSLPCL
jgi:signal transduction histidine kinase